MLIPILLIEFVHKRELSEHGWQLRGLLRRIWISLGLFPVVYVASTRQAF